MLNKYSKNKPKSIFWFAYVMFHVSAVFLLLWTLLQAYFNQAFSILPYTLFGETPIKAVASALIPSIILLSINIVFGFVKLKDSHKLEFEGESKALKETEDVNFEKEAESPEILTQKVSQSLSDQPKIESPISIQESKKTLKTFDEILAEIILNKIEELDVAPEITISNEGKYDLLGRKWDGKVSISIKKRQKIESPTSEKSISLEDENKIEKEEEKEDKNLEEGEKYNPF